MAVELTPANESDIDRLITLFAEIFHLKEGAPLLNPALLRWKYFEPRPDWAGARSYVLHSGSRWLAHVCVCPMVFRSDGRMVKGILLVDWVSAVPGAGAGIYRSFYPMVDVLFGNGGSTKARRIMRDLLKYPIVGSVEMYSRVFKPWAIYRHGKRSGGDLLRLVRNSVLSAAPCYRHSPDWTYQPVEQFSDAHQSICDSIPEEYLQTIRSPELLNYFLRCPLAKMSAYLVLEGSQARGYFILAEFESYTKLADLRVSSGSQADWATAIALATQAASKLGAPMFFVTSTLPMLSHALKANRFRRFDADPLYCYDPCKRLMPANLPLHVTPFDGDQAYQ